MALIFDVGAHKGEDTEFYLKKGFKVIAVEANAALAQMLRERFSEAIGRGQLVIVEAAISDTEGEVEFFVNDRSVFGTTSREWAERNEKMGAHSTKVKVRAVPFTSLLSEYGAPYYLKVDIEGADMLCVHALGDIQSRPSYVSIESNKTSYAALLSEFRAFEDLGYRQFKVINQTKIPSQNEPNPAREGNTTGHQFPEGSTGLFGADLPGPWLNKTQAIIKYTIIFIQYRFFGDNTIGERLAKLLPWRIHRFMLPAWYDTHAKF